MRMRKLLAIIVALALCVSCMPNLFTVKADSAANGDLLTAIEEAYWVYANKKTVDTEGYPTLSWNYATFIGNKVADQRISLTFHANMVKDGSWIGIQFRGKLTPEEASQVDTVEYYKTNNDALALVIKGKGSQIAINGGNGEGGAVNLSGNVEVASLADGKDHTVELITEQLETGNVQITVRVDGEEKLTYEASEKYARAGYVTLACPAGDDAFTLKRFCVEGLKASDYQVGQQIAEENNLLKANREHWASYLYNNGSIAWTDNGLQLSHGTVSFLGEKANNQKITVTLKTPLSNNGFLIQFRGNMDAEMANSVYSYATNTSSGHTSLGFRVRNQNTGVSLNESYSTGGAGMKNTGTVYNEQTNALSRGDACYTVDIVTMDLNDTTTNIKIYVDGLKVIDKDQTNILPDGYVSFACEGTDTVEITGLQIAGVTAKTYAQDLLHTDGSFWAYSGDDPAQSDGSIILSNNFATFIGSQVRNQMITMEFSAALSDWAAIQFRGTIMPELATDAEQVAYYSTSNDALALVMKNSGSQISINAGNGTGLPTRLSDNADVSVCDGSTHLLQIVSKELQNGKVGITVMLDGSSVLNCTVAEKYARAGYVTLACQSPNDSLQVKRFSVEGFKEEDYVPEGPQAPDPDTNLLGAEHGYWKIVRDSDDDGFQQDGSLKLSNAYATFVGEKAGAQVITVKFRATLTDWAAIQFRGNVTAEQAEQSETVKYYSPSNQALALVIKNGGSQISINSGDGTGAPTRLSDNVDVALGDGSEHTIQIITEDRSDGKVDIAVWIDGANKLSYQAKGDYAHTGYVTLACQNVTDLLEVGYFSIENVKVSELSLGCVDSWNLVLGDDIGMEFVMEINEFVAQSDTARLQITVADNKSEVMIPAAVDGKYKIQVNVAAAQMTDVVSLQLTDGELKGTAYEYTVRQYADYILNDANGYSKSVKNLVKAMLTYGGKAQAYFAYNTSSRADDGIDVTPVQIPAGCPAVDISGKITGVQYYGATLLFETKTMMRYYFLITGDISDYTFTVDGQIYNAVGKDGLYYIEIPGTAPQTLANAVVLTVSNGTDLLTVSYSPVHYIVRMYNGNSIKELKDLLEALYSYHLAAKAYLEQLTTQTLDVSDVSVSDWEETVNTTDPIN